MTIRKIGTIVLVALLFVGCSTNKPNTPAGGESNPAVTISNEEKYASILDAYKKALEENYDMEKYYDHGLNPLCYYYGDSKDIIGYAFDDLDGDGNDELIIGAGAYQDMLPTIFDIVTYDGTPNIAFQGGERSYYFVTTDNVVVNTGSNSAYSGGNTYYQLKNGQFEIVTQYLYDYSKDEENPYYKVVDGKDVPVSNEEAQTKLDEAYNKMKNYKFTSLTK